MPLMPLYNCTNQGVATVEYGNQINWGIWEMHEGAKLNDLDRSGHTHSQSTPCSSPSTPTSHSPDMVGYNQRVVINSGVLAGWYGQRIHSDVAARCLVQLEGTGYSLVVEIDEELVEWQS